MITIAIDFDGVICNLKGIKRPHDFEYAEPHEGTKEAIEELIKNGYGLWIFTSRPQVEWKDMEKWLERYHIAVLPISNVKENATIYLDDRAVRFTNWQDFCKLLI